jgi:hypothetical protein
MDLDARRVRELEAEVHALRAELAAHRRETREQLEALRRAARTTAEPMTAVPERAVAPERSMGAPSSATAVPTASASSALSAEATATVRAQVAALEASSAAQAALAKSFDRLLDAWGDPTGHKALLALASQTGDLAFAGQRYRIVLGVVPDDPISKRAQGEILTLAMAAMKARPDPGGAVPKDAETKRVWVWAARIGAAIVAAFVLSVMVGKVLQAALDPATLDIADEAAMQD